MTKRSHYGAMTSVHMQNATSTQHPVQDVAIIAASSVRAAWRGGGKPSSDSGFQFIGLLDQRTAAVEPRLAAPKDKDGKAPEANRRPAFLDDGSSRGLKRSRRLLSEFRPKDFEDLGAKRRSLIGCRLPNKGPVDSEILMHQHVPKTDNIRPGHRRMTLFDFRSEPGNRLAHNGQPLRDSVA